MLRIAIIAHLKYPIAEPFFGGLEMHTHLLARNLIKEGHEVTLYASSNSDPNLGLHGLGENTRKEKIPSDEREKKEFLQEHYIYFKLMMQLRKSKFDVIHNNSLHYLPISMAPLLPAPMVTTLHTPPFDWLAKAIQYNQEDNNSLVAISQKTKELWKEVYPVKHVIFNGIDIDDFPFSSYPASPPYAVWHGRIVPEKGLHLAIAAAKKAGIVLKIAGPISDHSYYEKEIVSHFDENIIYYGHLDHKALYKLIAGATVSICTPRWEEPYGLVIAESLAAGVPIAGFRRGALPELVTEKTGALARPDDIEDLAQAIRKAIHCERIESRKIILEKATSTVMIKNYIQLYKECIAKKLQQ